jgi:hypothetical protein
MLRIISILRALSLAALAMCPLVACGDNTVISGCGELPATEGCIDSCTGLATSAICSGGNWQCPASPCDGECGPPPQVDCGAACGNGFAPQGCVDGKWSCPDYSNVECPPDPLPPEQGSALWSTSMGGDGYENTTDVAIDGEGNVIVIGAFQQQSIAPGDELASAGGYDVVIAKYDSIGNTLWRQRRGGSGDELGQGVGVDALGNIVILETRASSAGQPAQSGQVHLVKLDPMGNQLWEVPFGHSQSLLARFRPISVDSSGRITMIGEAQQGDLIGGQPMPETGVFVARFDSDGQLLWNETFVNDDYVTLGGVSSDDAGNVFVTGMFKGSLPLGTLTIAATGDGFDGFLFALDNSGATKWGGTLGAFAGNETGADVAADGVGGVAIVGAYSDFIDIGGIFLSATGDRSAFVAHFDQNGVPSWGQNISGVDGFTGGADLFRVAVDELGDVLVGGHFEEETNIALPATAQGQTDIFIARFQSDGAQLWGWSLGDINSDSVDAIATGPNGTCVVTGKYFGAPDLGNGKLAAHTQGSLFVALFDADGQ